MFEITLQRLSNHHLPNDCVVLGLLVTMHYFLCRPEKVIMQFPTSRHISSKIVFVSTNGISLNIKDMFICIYIKQMIFLKLIVTFGPFENKRRKTKK